MDRRTAITFILGMVLSGAALHAQPVRTFVSTSGLDSNPCSLADPCRNFGAAVAAVAVSGEVVALDSGGYGAAVLNKSVSLIAAPGIHAAIAPTSGNAISQTAFDGKTVILRGLYLQAHGGSEGIRLDGAQLHVERTTVRGFTFAGIRQHFGKLTVVDSVFADNFIGVSAADSLLGSFSRTRFLNNSSAGVQAYLNARANFVDCVASGNGDGFRASGITGHTAEMTLERCVATHNTQTAFLAESSVQNGGGGDALMRVSNSTATGNNRGVLAYNPPGCGTVCVVEILTRNNNTVEGNTTDGAFNGSLVAK